MIIYEFSTWGTNGEMYSVKEIEVEEKPKTYISTKNMRIKKEDIDKLQSHYGHRMFRLDSNPQHYIEAMINKKRFIMERLTKDLERATAEFNKWFDLKQMVGEDN